MAATQSGFLRLEPETGEMHTFAIPPQGMVGCRFNDGKCDAMGRLWAGTLSLDGTPGQGALFRLDTDGSVHLIESGFDVCNGLGWSPDSTRFYLTDSGQRSIFVYDFDVTLGLVSNKRRLVRFDGIDGTPDGLSVDQEGNLWCAMWDGWAIQQIRPNGSTGKAIRLPLPRPTSCAFGGDDGKTLFITSARTRLTADQLAEAPLSGSILSVSMDIPGAYVDIYGG